LSTLGAAKFPIGPDSPMIEDDDGEAESLITRKTAPLALRSRMARK